jgi:hypothetical protein
MGAMTQGFKSEHDVEKRAVIEAKKIRRAEREADLGRTQRECEPGKFGVILADVLAADRETILSKAARDCVLFVRCKGPTNLLAIELIRSCGFKYKSEFVRKLDYPDAPDPSGLFTNAHEAFLVSARGKVVAPAPGTQFDSVIEVPIAKVIRTYFPTIKMVTLCQG